MVPNLELYKSTSARSRLVRLAVPAVIGALAVSVAAATQAAAGTAAPAASGPRVVATIKAAGVESVAVSPVTGQVYAATGITYATGAAGCDYPRVPGQVLVISGKTSKVGARIKTECASGPLAVSPATGNVYLPTVKSRTSTGGTVTVINRRTGKVAAAIPVRGVATSVTVSPVTGNVYAVSHAHPTGLAGWTLTVINGRTNKAIATIPVYWDATVSPVTGDVYAPAPSGTSVLVISGTTSKVLATVPLGLPAQDRYAADSILASPVNGDVYVESDGDHDVRMVSVISGTTSKVTATVVAGGQEQAGSIALSPVTGNVYLANDTADEITMISAKTSEVTADLQPAGIHVISVAVSPRSGDLYASEADGSTVWEFSGTTNQAIGKVQVSGGTNYVPSPFSFSRLTGDTYAATTKGISVIAG